MLISTDVAAMGLDVNDLNLSINIGRPPVYKMHAPPTQYLKILNFLNLSARLSYKAVSYIKDKRVVGV